MPEGKGKGDLGWEVGKSWLEGTDSRTPAFSIEIQQARHRDRKAKTKKQKGENENYTTKDRGHCLNGCTVWNKRLSK
jgi:hypothetical protein